MGQGGRSFVCTASYMQQLSELLPAILPDNVTLTIDADQGEMEAKKASAIGMIVSEFVANSTKHAFPEARRGQITITLKNPQGKDWILVRADDGVGTKPTSETSLRSTGMGEMLMASAALQLDGRGENEAGDQGTQPCVQFTS